MPPRLHFFELPKIALVIGVTGCVLGLLIGSFALHETEVGGTAIILLGLAWGAVFQTRWLVSRRRLERSLHENDGALCGHCRHFLLGLGDGGECPECGTSFVLDNLRRRWGSALYPRGKGPGFWKAQFTDEYTENQGAFDICFGVIVPIICFLFDPVVFSGGPTLLGSQALLGSWWWIAHTALLMQLTLMMVWLIWRRRAAGWRFVRGGAMIGGALGAFAIGTVLLPISVIGLVILIGALGFAPWFAGLAWLRGGVRSVHDLFEDQARLRRRLAAVIAGAAVAIGLPIAVHIGVRGIVDRSIAAILSADDPAAVAREQRAMRIICSVRPCEGDELVFAWNRAQDSQRALALNAAYVEMCGELVSRRWSELTADFWD